MINIDKSLVTPDGVTLGFHRIEKIEVSRDLLMLNVYGGSWPTATTRAGGTKPVDNWMYQVPISSLVGAADMIAEMADFMVTNGEMAGGTVVPPEGQTLEDAKALRWSQVKMWRTQAISENLPTPYGVFQCREEDRQNITDAVLLANTLTAMQQPVAITWTLADNSSVVLDLTMIVTVALLLGQRVQEAHAHGRWLRTLIDEATTVEAVNEVVWELTEPE